MAGKRKGPVFTAVETKVTAALQPIRLGIIDESSMHAGHAGNPSGSEDAESHFRLEIVASSFEGKSLVARHRLVYGILAEEMKGRIHALSLKLKTPDEAASE